MSAQYRDDGKVIADCHNCRTRCTFMPAGGPTLQMGENYLYNGTVYNVVEYSLYVCGGCGHGGLAKLRRSPDFKRQLEFYPAAIEIAELPSGIPQGIVREFREAELCAASGAHRAASAMLRSTLEKTLSANGYNKGSLYEKVELAARDGVLTDARRKRAQDEIRSLGNDVVHDDWREVTADEYQLAHHYAQRVMEDLYDDRKSVEGILVSKGRLPAATAATTP